MRALEIDAEAGTAWAEPGLTAGVTTAAAERGLATGFGDTASVGIGGITLAGGVGYLVRKHGLTIDDLLAELVTADGQILEIDDERHPELFWAIRGGGGNFGVTCSSSACTRWPRSSAACWCCWPPPRSSPGSSPPRRPHPRSCRPSPTSCPPRRCRSSLPPSTASWSCWKACHAGEAEAGQRRLAPFRPGHPAGRPGAADALPGHALPEEEGFHLIVVVHTMFLDRVDSDTAGTILEHLAASDAMMAQLRVLGGAMARVPAEATAFAHRGSPIMATVVCFYQGPADKPGRQAWLEELAAALRQGYHAYTGFLGEDGPARVHRAYPGSTWDRGWSRLRPAMTPPTCSATTTTSHGSGLRRAVYRV